VVVFTKLALKSVQMRGCEQGERIGRRTRHREIVDVEVRKPTDELRGRKIHEIRDRILVPCMQFAKNGWAPEVKIDDERSSSDARGIDRQAHRKCGLPLPRDARANQQCHGRATDFGQPQRRSRRPERLGVGCERIAQTRRAYGFSVLSPELRHQGNARSAECLDDVSLAAYLAVETLPDDGQHASAKDRCDKRWKKEEERAGGTGTIRRSRPRQKVRFWSDAFQLLPKFLLAPQDACIGFPRDRFLSL